MPKLGLSTPPALVAIAPFRIRRKNGSLALLDYAHPRQISITTLVPSEIASLTIKCIVLTAFRPAERPDVGLKTIRTVGFL